VCFTLLELPASHTRFGVSSNPFHHLPLHSITITVVSGRKEVLPKQRITFMTLVVMTEAVSEDERFSLLDEKGEMAACSPDARCLRFRPNFALEDAIGIHAFAPLEALPCVCPIACLSGVHFLLLFTLSMASQHQRRRC
jgi:hypothetical protein